MTAPGGDVGSAPRWAAPATMVLAVLGLGIAIYLTIAHYSDPKLLICSDQGTINCAKVTTSSQSMVFGVLPVAVLGLAYFAVMVPLCSPAAWRSEWPWLAWLRAGLAVVGVGFILYLIYAELFQIDAICLWCTATHTVTFLLFVAVLAAGLPPWADVVYSLRDRRR